VPHRPVAQAALVLAPFCLAYGGMTLLLRVPMAQALLRRGLRRD